MRAHGVLYRGGQPANHRVTNILRAEIGIVFRRRGDFGDDGVLESGGFEGRLPILDAAFHPGDPFGGCSGVDPIDDGLHGFRELRGGIFLFQAPAADVAATRRALFVAAIVHLAHGKIADSVVKNTRRHRIIGEFHHAVVQDNGGAAGAHTSSNERIRGSILLVRRRGAPGIGDGGRGFGARGRIARHPWWWR